MIILLAAALAASASASVQPQAQPASAPPPPSAQPDAAAEKPVCRRAIPTGSMFSKRTCHSKAEWMAIDERNAQDAQTARDRAGSGTPRGQ